MKSITDVFVRHPVLALVVNVVGAGSVPVGGGLGKSRTLVARLDREVRARILRRTTAPLIVPAQLDVEPGLVGAAILFDAVLLVSKSYCHAGRPIKTRRRVGDEAV